MGTALFVCVRRGIEPVCVGKGGGCASALRACMRACAQPSPLACLPPKTTTTWCTTVQGLYVQLDSRDASARKARFGQVDDCGSLQF